MHTSVILDWAFTTKLLGLSALLDAEAAEIHLPNAHIKHIPPRHKTLKITPRIRCLQSPAASHQSDSHECDRDVEGLGCGARAGVAVRRLAAAVAHGVHGAFEAEAVLLAAGRLRHAAPGRQCTVVAIETFGLEAQLVGRALGHNELKFLLLLQDGAVVAKQVVTQHRGEEKEETEHGKVQELQHVGPASRRDICYFRLNSYCGNKKKNSH